MPAYTICYTRTESGYMGQLLEWPEVISEGATLEECRVMVEDAALEMLRVYEEDGLPVPQGHAIFETIAITIIIIIFRFLYEPSININIAQ